MNIIWLIIMVVVDEVKVDFGKRVFGDRVGKGVVYEFKVVKGCVGCGVGGGVGGVLSEKVVGGLGWG